MSKRKKNQRFRVDVRQYDSEQVIKSMTTIYRPSRKMPEAKSELRYSTKKEEK